MKRQEATLPKVGTDDIRAPIRSRETWLPEVPTWALFGDSGPAYYNVE